MADYAAVFYLLIYLAILLLEGLCTAFYHSFEAISEMDFEELESLCEDNDLDTDPDNYDEEDIEKLRKSIAKELGMTLPKGKSKKK